MIPGVDDGAPDFETALESLSLLVQDGVTAVVATPHLNASRPNGSRRQRADENWPELQRRAAESLPDLELYRGFEVLLDTPDVDLSDEGLRIASSRFALVEFHAFTIPARSVEALGSVREAGYVPILAHPERYFGYDRELSVVPDWRSAGALLQVNSGSLFGEYGDRARKIAQQMLAHGWVDLIASDNHGHPHRRPSLRAVWNYFAEQGLDEAAYLLISSNPHRVIHDRVPHGVGPVELDGDRGLLARLKQAFMGDT